MEPELENIVVRIGGASLFGGRALLAPMQSLIRAQPHQRLFVLLGGGDTVESMRALHASFPQLDLDAMHWRCVRLLDATWEVGRELFPETVPLGTWDRLQAARSEAPGNSYLVRASAFYSPDTLARIPRELRPSHDWDTTTDALSWVLAALVQAAELRLVKRGSIDPDLSIHDAVRSGIIDPQLPRLVAGCDLEHPPKIRFVSLEGLA